MGDPLPLVGGVLPGDEAGGSLVSVTGGVEAGGGGGVVAGGGGSGAGIGTGWRLVTFGAGGVVVALVVLVVLDVLVDAAVVPDDRVITTGDPVLWNGATLAMSLGGPALATLGARLGWAKISVAPIAEMINTKVTANRRLKGRSRR